MAKTKTWWGKVTGEISKLRNQFQQSLGNFFVTGSASYSLDSTTVDYKLARELYDNTRDDYKLGGGFAAPIINVKAGFMGVPSFSSVDEEAQETLNSFIEANRSKIYGTLVNSMRDGDAYVWITNAPMESGLYPEYNNRIMYNIIPPERVETLLDPVTGEVVVYKITTPMQWVDEDGEKKCTITHFLRSGQVETQIEGDQPPNVQQGTVDTGLDYIPMVHFKNKGYNMQYGQSELEPIEPFLKAYHDVMLHAMQGSKMHSTPKLTFRLSDVESFLQVNMPDAYEQIKQGQSPSISLDGREIIFLQDDDESEFLEVTSAIGDATTLLKFIFYNIVDASETPEFVFGVHTPSSQASVTEQMPVLIRAIEAKRDHFSDSFDRLARIVLDLTANTENMLFGTYETELVWDNIDPRTDNQVAEELNTTITALSTAVSSGLMSDKSAVDFLAKMVDTMLPYDEGEAERIKKYELNKYRMPDSEDLEKELETIKNKLGDVS